jgi:XRE family transcriptional regulator, regulator of sulfur utilization
MATKEPATTANASKDGRAEEPHTRASTLPVLSAKLRGLRQGGGLSLSEVADATGISASFLSLVENGKSDITIGRLTRLVEFYRVSITDLLPPHPAADAHVVRRGEGHRLHSVAEDIDIELLTPDTHRAMMPLLLEFKPGAERAEYGSHASGTEEFVHVISGVLILELAGSEPRRLRSGDSAYYPGDHPHLFRNGSRTRPLRVLCINDPPVL